MHNILTAGADSSCSLKFHFQRPGAGFPEAPDYQARGSVHFAGIFQFDSQRRLYYEVFINLNGDFNGDGKKDLLAKDRKDAISVYFFHSGDRVQPGSGPQIQVALSRLSNGR